MATGTPVGIGIVEQVADREGVDPLDLDTRLYDVIDVDALEALLSGTDDRQPQAAPRVEFTYCGYAVTVDEAGEVTLENLSLESEGEGATDAATGD